MLHVFSKRFYVIAVFIFLNMAMADGSYTTSNSLPPQQHVVSGALSYREWKKMKIQESEKKVKEIKNKIESDPNLKSSNKTEAGLNRDLENEILNLSITNDLTISDYFVGYLSKQPSLNSAIREVSVKLSSDEVAELMTAYAENFFQNDRVAPPRAEARTGLNQ